MLELEFKAIAEDTKDFMKDAVGNCHDYYDEAVCTVQELLPSNETHILNSANSCILTVVEALDGPILTVDMGGWNGFKKSCDILGKKYSEIPTDNGMINIEELKNYFEENDVNSLYITGFVAYCALQPICEIYNLCNLYDVRLILDISGTIGYPNINSYCDIQIASTGSPKIVNTENGGFINNISKKISLNKHLIKTLKADQITCAAIANEIKKAPYILKKTINANTYFKNNLNSQLDKYPNYEIIHEKETGINTIIKVESKKKAKQLAYNIKKNLKISNNKSIITTGPNYNRIKTASVNVEIKNINPTDLSEEKMDKLIEIIIKEIEDMDKN